MVSNANELMHHSKGPCYNTLINAERKAQKVSKKLKDGFVIGADSLVLLRGRLIGKPKTKKEAKCLLKNFSGKTIYLYTGLCVKDIKNNKTAKAVTVSRIKIQDIDTKDLDKYLKKLGPFDKAGGFSIEGVGSLVFDNIKGSFYNILGLPTITLNELFRKLGVDLLEYIKS